MPIYEYDCTQCAKRTEVIQRMGGAPLKVCPHCGGRLKKAFSAPAIQFKGSGWYVTDYARASKESGGKKESESSGEAKSEKSESAGKSEKSESAGKSEKVEKKGEKKEKKKASND
jgi:putative FmdB family regulatory protein